MKIEINKKTTLEGLELDLLCLKEELCKVRDINTDLAKQFKELTDELVNKGIISDV